MPVNRTGFAPSTTAPDARTPEAGPSSVNGASDGPAAKHQVWCSADVPVGAARCPRCGVWQPHNRGALNVGQHSAQFWRDADDQRVQIVSDVLKSAGFADTTAAPITMRIAADALAQSMLIRDAAFARLSDAGGPLTSADRTRRAFNVWESASAAVERCLKLLGRANATTQPSTPDLASWLAESEDVQTSAPSALDEEGDDA
jgi:hypothetical protein